jgi:hypothetical protein
MNSAPGSNTRAIIFRVVTNFETMARRPGGVPRDQAVLNARIRVQRLSGCGSKPIAKTPPPRAPGIGLS